MVNYKCIKKYPSIIEVGDIAKLNHNIPSYDIYRNDKMVATEWLNFVRKFPEFWEKIVVVYSGADVIQAPYGQPVDVDNLCKASEFRSRQEYICSEEEMNIIKNISLTDLNTIPDVDNPEKYRWYEIGNEKYGRTMYCPDTKIRRGTTMGEFYQNATVD